MTYLRSGCLWAGMWFILAALDIAPKFLSEDFWLMVVGYALFLAWLPPVPRNTKSKEGTS